MRFISKLRQYIEGINKVAGLISGLLLLLVGGMMCCEVLLRANGRPSAWLPEWSGYLFSWAMVGGAAYTLMRKRHVQVELLQMHLSPRLNAILDFIGSLMGLAFCALVSFSGWQYFIDTLQTGETTSTTLRIPLWIISLPIFVSFVLLVLQFALFAFDAVVAMVATGKAPIQDKEDAHA